ncbi:hypothetical protein AHAS_Ahas03G0213500 [Arachis hypogaea]
MHQELWTIYKGLKIAIEMGLNRVLVEMDSTCLVKLLQRNSSSFYSNTTLTQAIKVLQVNLRNFRIHHMLKEANFSANVLAKEAHSFSMGLFRFATPFPFLAPTLNADRRE